MSDRERFEAHHACKGCKFVWNGGTPIHLNPDTDYVRDMATDWRAWQAATAAERERCAKYHDKEAAGFMRASKELLEVGNEEMAGEWATHAVAHTSSAAAFREGSS